MDMSLNQNQFLSDQFMALPPLPPVTASQDWVMSPHHVMGIGDVNIGGAIFSEDQHPYTTNPQQQLHHVYDPFISPTNQAPPLGQLPSSSSTDLSMEFSQFLAHELDRQTTEMEAYLHLQTECSFARRNEAEKYATNLVSLIEKKENELALAKQTSMEIEQCMLRTDAQVKSWQKLALEKEAKVTELSYKLKKVEERIQMLNSGALDADSTCGDTPLQDKSIMMDVYGKCKVCQAQHSCVVLFPCKHLCCCKSCEAIVNFCPMCESLKKASMEIFLG